MQLYIIHFLSFSSAFRSAQVSDKLSATSAVATSIKKFLFRSIEDWHHQPLHIVVLTCCNLFWSPIQVHVSTAAYTLSNHIKSYPAQNLCLNTETAAMQAFQPFIARPATHQTGQASKERKSHAVNRGIYKSSSSKVAFQYVGENIKQWCWFRASWCSNLIDFFYVFELQICSEVQLLNKNAWQPFLYHNHLCNQESRALPCNSVWAKLHNKGTHWNLSCKDKSTIQRTESDPKVSFAARLSGELWTALAVAFQQKL